MTERPDRRAPRESLLLPVLIPVVVLVVIGASLWLFSRVLLQLTHTAAWITALLVGAGILVVSTVIVSRRQITGAAMFSLFGGMLGVTMFVGGAALLVGQESAEEHGGGEEPVVLAIAAPEGAAVDGYDTDALTAPAGVAFSIAFDNQDPGVLHNVAVAPAEGETAFFEGELITGPATIDYGLEPLEAADYFFFCTVHPTTMTGTLSVAEGAEPGGGGGGAPVVVAKDLLFDTDTIELPADTASQVVMDNQDAGVPHNISIYADDSLSEVLFQGELIDGPAEVTYEIPALPAGEYYFQCDVHPAMNGTVIVGGDGGGGGGEPPAEPTGSATPTETASPTEPPDDGGGGGGGAGEVAATIVAVNLLFDPTSFTVPAGEPSIVTMDNQDGGVPHNIAIYTDDSAAESLFVGELVTGPVSIDYEVPALDPGEYFFRCDIHPTTMVGSVTAA